MCARDAQGLAHAEPSEQLQETISGIWKCNAYVGHRAQPYVLLCKLVRDEPAEDVTTGGASEDTADTRQ